MREDNVREGNVREDTKQTNPGSHGRV